RLAGDDAGAAAGADIQVDHHAPLVGGAQMFALVVKSQSVPRQRHSRWILNGSRPNQLAILHQMVFLGACQGKTVLSQSQRQPGGQPRTGGGAKLVGIEAAARADATCARTSIAEVNSNGVVGMAWQYPEGRSYTTSLQCQFHDLLICQIR